MKFQNNEVRGGIDYIVNGNEEIEISIFGKHNMMNINGARLVCNKLGITDKDFLILLAVLKVQLIV